MKKIIKKKNVFISGILMIMLVSGVLCFYKLNFEIGIHSFEEINVGKINSAIANGENLVVYYGKESCGACRVFTPTLEKASKITEKKVYFLDGDNLESKSFSKDYNIHNTPTLLIINEGKLLRYEGTFELDETIKILSGEEREESTVWK